jgi:hypothetical protein
MNRRLLKFALAEFGLVVLVYSALAVRALT